MIEYKLDYEVNSYEVGKYEWVTGTYKSLPGAKQYAKKLLKIDHKMGVRIRSIEYKLNTFKIKEYDYNSIKILMDNCEEDYKKILNI